MVDEVILTAEDYDDVVAVWQSAGLHIRPAGRDTREAFAKQIASGCQTVIGLRDGDRLVGVVLATNDSRRGWINRLAIHPDYQQQGLGMRLINACERHFKQDLGLFIISAHIEDENTASLGLFAKAGYHHHPEVHYFAKRDSNDV